MSCVRSREFWRKKKDGMQTLNTLLELVVFLEPFKEVFYELFRLLRIAIVIPVSSASCERSFSALSLIKNKLRTTTRLSHLGVLSIESRRAKSLDMNEFVRRFSLAITTADWCLFEMAVHLNIMWPLYSHVYVVACVKINAPMESKKGNYNLLCKAHIHKKLSFVTMKVKDSNTFYCTSEITILLLRVGQQQFHLLDHKCITYISRDESSSRSRTVTGLCPAEGPCQSDRQDSTDLLSKNQTIYIYIFWFKVTWCRFNFKQCNTS